MRYLLSFLVVLSLFGEAICQSAQPMPDSVSLSIVEFGDTLFKVQTSLFYENEDGELSEIKALSSPLDSAETVDKIRELEVYGGTVGEVRFPGRIQISRAAQSYFATTANAAISDALGELYEQHTGGVLDRDKTEFDNLFLDYWILVSRLSGTRVETPVEIVRRTNGNLVAEVAGEQPGEVLRTQASIQSRDEIVLRNIGDVVGRLSFYRIRPADRRFLSIAGDVALIPDFQRRKQAQ